MSDVPLSSIASPSATPVNGTTNIRSIDQIIIDGGSTFLRSGYIQSDLGLYPLATRSVGASLGVTYPVIANPTCTCWDGTYHWVGSRASTIITQYDSSWNPTGLTKDIGILPRSLDWDGTNFWALQSESSGASKVFRKYDASWVYIAPEYNVSAYETLPRGIASDGVNVHIVGTEKNLVQRWTVGGVYVDEFFSVSSLTDVPADITIVDSKFWIVSRYTEVRGGVIGEFSELGVPTGREFPPVGDSSAMDWDGTNFWTTRYDGTVWKYSGEYIGIPQFQQSSSGNVYMRVA